MDTGEKEGIFPNKTNNKILIKEKTSKKPIKVEIKDKNYVSFILFLLTCLTIIVLFINFFQIILLYKGINKLENKNNADMIPEKHIKTNKKSLNQLNQNLKNTMKENPNSFANTSINLKEEIEKFVISRRNISSKEISDYRLLNSENILFDQIKYKKSESPMCICNINS